MIKKCKIIPRFNTIPDLDKYKHIEYPCMMFLNTAEIIRVLHYADLYEILPDNTEVLLNPMNFDKDNYHDDDQYDEYPEVIGMPGIHTFQIGSVGYGAIGLARVYS